MSNQTNQAAVPATQAANGGAVHKTPKKVDVLKGILKADSVQEQFRNALGKNSSAFVASVIDLYNTDKNLQECNPTQVVMEALKAAVLKLPISRALGCAYVVAYKNKKKITDPQTGLDKWVKVPEPTFQLGYRGYIQLAMRTNQYRTINADAVYEGELRKVNKLTGEIAFDGEKTSDKVVGYFCYFELLNGFSKTLYMTVNQMAVHAKRYSKGLGSDVTVEQLENLAKLPVAPDSKSVGWMGNFHGMAYKTVIRLLLSKYGYLSIEMQQAFADDVAGDSLEVRDGVIQESGNSIVMDMDDTQYEDVTDQSQNALPGNAPAAADPQIIDPGY